MKKGIICSLAVLVLCLSLLSGLAWARNMNQFVLHNDSEWTITSFRTQEGNESFSTNWIKGDRIAPGDSFDMEFFEDGPCDVRVKVTSSDGYVHDYVIDFCRARDIFIENQRISYR